ncbi:MAG TPA: hypothetical protein V6D10_07280 [Trichocoleus sp.]|jgi:hypothetical protein
MNIQLAQIREELTSFMPGKTLCNETWQRYKRIVGVADRKRTCSRDQWVLLCACVAFRRMRRSITPIALKIFVRNNQNDPMAFLPGYIPQSALNDVPDVAVGLELAEAIERKTSYCPSEWTLRRWTARLGYGKWSRHKEFSEAQIKAYINLYFQIRYQEIERGHQNNFANRRNVA